MSYHIYQTEGFIIDSLDTGEANKLVTLYTADLGLIRAAAQGVRVTQSKLRPSLQDLSFSSFALVRGKEVWRITSARKLISLYDRRIPVGARMMMARILSFVKRMVTGESPNADLFAILSGLSAFCFSQREQLSSKESIESVELIATLRILDVLGYASSDLKLKKYLDREQGEKTTYTWSGTILSDMRTDVELAKSEISRAVRESHL